MVQTTCGDMKQCFYEHIPNFYFLIMFIYQFDVFGFFLTESSGSAQHVAFLKKENPDQFQFSRKSQMLRDTPEMPTCFGQKHQV